MCLTKTSTNVKMLYKYKISLAKIHCVHSTVSIFVRNTFFRNFEFKFNASITVT